MTMTTGEFDFDSIFRQDPAGGSDGAEEIPFPPISYMLWIVFVIIMPILLTNMLVSNMAINFESDLYFVSRLVLQLVIFKLFKMKLHCKSWHFRLVKVCTAFI